MIETIFVLEKARQRQREAPLLRERELFLAHLLQLGCDRKQVRSIASLLLHVIRLLQLQTLRHIYPEEIAAAGQHWANDMPHKKVGAIAARRFSYVANKWFRFHNVLVGPPRDKKPYDEVINQFLNAMQTLRDWAPTTLYGYRGRVSKFLEWCFDRNLSLFSISLRDVDRFLAEKRANGWCLRTLTKEEGDYLKHRMDRLGYHGHGSITRFAKDLGVTRQTLYDSMTYLQANMRLRANWLRS